jgi:hypothetical protein
MSGEHSNCAYGPQFRVPPDHVQDERAPRQERTGDAPQKRRVIVRSGRHYGQRWAERVISRHGLNMTQRHAEEAAAAFRQEVVGQIRQLRTEGTSVQLAALWGRECMIAALELLRLSNRGPRCKRTSSRRRKTAE